LVFLPDIDDHRTVILNVSNAIPISVSSQRVVCARISNTIGVRVGLVEVRNFYAIIALIADRIAVVILLVRISDQPTVVLTVEYTITISVSRRICRPLACIASPVAIGICLICIGIIDAVITGVSDFVAITIFLVGVRDVDTVIKHIAYAVGVCIHPRITGIAHAISVGIVLLEVCDAYTVIACVTHAIAVGIRLAGIRHTRTIITSVEDPITILIPVRIR
jgi:hypothetical protein